MGVESRDDGREFIFSVILRGSTSPFDRNAVNLLKRLNIIG
jgi:hypothetical protein